MQITFDASKKKSLSSIRRTQRTIKPTLSRDLEHPASALAHSEVANHRAPTPHFEKNNPTSFREAVMTKAPEVEKQSVVVTEKASTPVEAPKSNFEPFKRPSLNSLEYYVVHNYDQLGKNKLYIAEKIAKQSDEKIGKLELHSLKMRNYCQRFDAYAPQLRILADYIRDMARNLDRRYQNIDYAEVKAKLCSIFLRCMVCCIMHSYGDIEYERIDLSKTGIHPNSHILIKIKYCLSQLPEIMAILASYHVDYLSKVNRHESEVKNFNKIVSEVASLRKINEKNNATFRANEQKIKTSKQMELILQNEELCKTIATNLIQIESKTNELKVIEKRIAILIDNKNELIQSADSLAKRLDEVSNFNYFNHESYFPLIDYGAKTQDGDVLLFMKQYIYDKGHYAYYPKHSHITDLRIESR